jgi:type IV pilus assembly protein PilE
MRGVTLIELMLCTLVLAILTALSIPGYRDFVLRAQRSDARGALLQLLANEERHFLQHGRYTADVAGTPAGGGLGMRAQSEAGLYALAVRLTQAGAGYVASATPLPDGTQHDDRRCSSFSIDERGTRTATGSAAQASRECWR